MQKKICPKCGEIVSHDQGVCECGFDFRQDAEDGEAGELEDAIDVLQSFARAGGSRLNVKAFALTCGIVWGLALFVGAWWIITFQGSGTSEPAFLSAIYWGYTTTPLGSVIGLGWGLLDGVVAGAAFAWLYNTLSAVLTLISKRSRSEQP